MIPFKSPLLLAVPPTLEKRLEALAALRTLQAQDEELARQRRVAIAALRRDVDELQRDFAALRHRLASDVRSDVMRALKYNPDQPRVPKGSPQGGQWTSEDGSSASPGPVAADEQRQGSTADPHVAQIFPPPLLFEDPVIVRPPLPEYPTNPKLPPGPDFEWHGQPGSQPGDAEGSWYNPKGPETLRPDMDHPPPTPPHWDYRAPSGKWYRWFPDGRLEPKLKS
jgi:hypothetical protein